MSSHFHPLKVREVRRETADCVSIRFEIPDHLAELFRFSQGQNITIRRGSGKEEIRRSYSICSSPLDQELRVAVKEVPEGQFSRFANRELRPGDVLEVLPPSGKFYTALDKNRSASYLAIAAGSGITPILSIIKTTLATEPKSSFTLLYGNRNRSAIIFREELEALKNRYMDRFSLIHILSREETEIPILSGRIDAAKCQELNRKLVDFSTMDDIFLCGPLPLIESVRDWLTAQGISSKHIHFELFNTPVRSRVLPERKAETQANNSTVTVIVDGIHHQFSLNYDGDSVLDAAVAAGADLPYACKGGVCATCKARLIKGSVEMDANFALEKEELDSGFILTCQSHPRTEEVTVDFDAK